MDTYRETFETWNKVALLYQDKFMDLDLYNDSYDLFCQQLLNTHPSVLEIGCGPGNITRYLLAKRPDIAITAVDVSPKMIELAKGNNPAANCKVMDCREIDTLKTSFDGIISGFCIPYLSETDITKFLNDCNHLLKDNGVLYLSFVEGDKSKSGFKKGSTGDRTYFYYLSLETLSQQLSNNHFRIEKLVQLDYPVNEGLTEIHSVILAKKIK